MVIPKMNRPTVWSSRKAIAERPGARIPAEDRSKLESKPSDARPEGELSSVPSIAARDAIPKRPVQNQPLQKPSIPRQPAGDSESNEAGVGPGFQVPQFANASPPLRRTRPFVTIGASSLAALLIAGIYLFALKPDPAAPKVPAPITVEAGPALQVSPTLWTPLSEWPRRISVVRGSMNLTDFRMDFQSPNNWKSIGWIFRAKDAKNFYALKLETLVPALGIVKPTPESSSPESSTVVLKRFAVIDGRDDVATQVPLSTVFRLGGMYKIRTEAVGNKFTTWISDWKVDEWTDARLGGGGVGLFSDRGEPASVAGDLALYPLLKK
jgi:hypothetical protein